jgi:putative glutamine amidotransferase
MMWSSATYVGAYAAGGREAVQEMAERAVKEVDSVIVTGGWDVDPSFYGAERSPLTEETEPVRDAFELAVVEAAQRQGKRVLGICRGHQVLNVAFGGTLIQDLPSAGFENHSDLTREYEGAHTVEFDASSLVAQVTNGEHWVNTLHHQAVDRVGDGLRATAISPDGVIEAIEGDGVIGVQWHPERLFPTVASHIGTFRWLIG